MFSKLKHILIDLSNNDINHDLAKNIDIINNLKHNNKIII